MRRSLMMKRMKNNWCDEGIMRIVMLGLVTMEECYEPRRFEK
jgi:hypothetical protein